LLAKGAAGGNPVFASQGRCVLRTLISIQPDAGRWCVGRPLQSLLPLSRFFMICINAIENLLIYIIEQITYMIYGFRNITEVKDVKALNVLENR